MEFLQKLDYMTQLSKTTYNMLADYISLDVSCFNRLRVKGGGPKMDTECIRAMATFFALHCTEKHQKEKLLFAMNKSGERVRGVGKLENFIFQWLSEDTPGKSGPTWTEAASSQEGPSYQSPCEKQQQTSNGAALRGGCEVYYGNEGRREASIKVLCEVLKMPEPRTLLLMCEENLDWMTENQDYMATWAALLQQVILRGNRIKVIHHVNRYQSDLMVAIRQWLPIYMTGLVEAYYNPRVKEIFFRRTLFVAPGCAAIFSDSVVGGSGKTANYLVRDSEAIEAAAGEFNCYLSICQPLFHICGEEQIKERQNKLAEFEAIKEDTFLITKSLVDLPISFEALKLATRSLDAEKRKSLLFMHQQRLKQFEELLSQHPFHIILDVPDLRKLTLRLRPLVYSSLECQNELEYTPESLRLQLQYLSRLLRSYDNFHIYMGSSNSREDSVIYGKVGTGAIIIRGKSPTIMFSFAESNLAEAIWSYTRAIVGDAFASRKNKMQMLKKLDALSKQIQPAAAQ